MGGNPYCHRCRGIEESLMHVIRDCPKAACIWAKIIHPCTTTLFFLVLFEIWLDINLNSDISKSSQEQWIDQFMITCWWIWNWRNTEVHNNNMNRPDNVVDIIRNYLREMKEAFAKQSLTRNTKSEAVRRTTWKAPPIGWTKLNTDGLVEEEEGKADYGGIIRTYKGEWIGGFLANLGRYSVYQSKVRAILHGLTTA
ncbi:Putative ribonuclease H protein [Arachis hypogaea]|nr:Putative ribonuclease H protein [Arachis hypogaea]